MIFEKVLLQRDKSRGCWVMPTNFSSFTLSMHGTQTALGAAGEIMKNLILLVLAITFITGCGALKHTKASPSTSSPTKQSLSENTDFSLTLTNENNGPVEWIPGPNENHEGEKFIALGKFSRAELGAFIGDEKDNVREIGTLRAIWNNKTYAPFISSADPKPNESTETKDYPNIHVYFTQDKNSLDTISISIAESKFSDLSEQKENTEIQYDEQMMCTELRITTVLPDSMQAWPLAFRYQSIASCDAFDCKYTKPYDGNFIGKLSRDQINAYLPFSTCYESDRLPTKKASVNNSSAVVAYEVVLQNPFSKIAATL
jgi:hypothetical protein